MMLVVIGDTNNLSLDILIILLYDGLMYKGIEKLTKAEMRKYLKKGSPVRTAETWPTPGKLGKFIRRKTIRGMGVVPDFIVILVDWGNYESSISPQHLEVEINEQS